MPSSSIEALGRLISRQVAGHPDRARALLRTAYTLVGVQMKYFPPKNVLPARCAMQGDTARSMAAALGRPGRVPAAAREERPPPRRGAPQKRYERAAAHRWRRMHALRAQARP